MKASRVFVPQKKNHKTTVLCSHVTEQREEKKKERDRIFQTKAFDAFLFNALIKI
jgi:hypothetical protein|tara:strand:- start:211 stop:375 length:165 start_codon:yes stop_codon:yes gene_type:complete